MVLQRHVLPIKETNDDANGGRFPAVNQSRTTKQPLGDELTYENIIVEREQHLLTVTINRPEVYNALSPATNFEMEQVFNEFEADPDLWVAIITGSGEKAFSVGGDIKEMAKANTTGGEYKIPKTGYGGLTSRFTCNKPLIAAVNGMALGGGFETAISCDLVVAAEHSEFGLPEPMIGTVAYASGMHRLPRQIGLKAAMEMLLTADRFSAQQAEAWGLVNYVVPAVDLMAEARKLADRLLKCAPIALQATKQCVMKGMTAPTLKTAMDWQEDGSYDLLTKMKGSEDVIEGIMSFAEKRVPQWKGR
jgi:enoyl-CoA hydratase/carnithine racemase